MPDFFAEQKKNRIKTWFLVLFFILFVGALGFGVDYYFSIREGGSVFAFPIFTAAALAIAVVHSFTAYFSGSKIVLSSLKARLADPSDLSEMTAIDVVKEMSLACGIPAPRVYIIPDDDPNAMATGRSPKHAYIGITKGLLDMMNREELQGVVAHEISHIRNYDTLVMTMVSALAGTIVLLSDWLRRTAFFTYDSGKRRKRRSRGGGGGGEAIVLLLILLISILAPIIARLLALAVSRTREYLADSSAVQLTRNPAGLASALRKIATWGGVIEVANQGTAHLFISDPLRRKLSEKEGLFADLFSTHPPIMKRIEILERMAHMRY